MRQVTVVTVARSDYGIYLPVLRQIRRTPALTLRLIVAGTHLAPSFGLTARQIEEDGFTIDDRVDMLLDGDTPIAAAKSIGVGILGFADAYNRARPDLLVVLGDRFEMLAAVMAALPFRIPIAHLHGGEASEGLFDESIRHAITKASHLHFVSTEWARSRVVQMGEEPWRVTVSGAPSLDNLHTMQSLDEPELVALIGMSLDPAPLLVTFHPVTLESADIGAQIRELLAALQDCSLPVVFTFPNADPGNRPIIDAMGEYVRGTASSRMLVNLGTRAYFSLMRRAAAMVGNSSSGIIEAASFHLPVVNVGNRQRGRMHARNVVDVPCDREAIRDAIGAATSAAFRASLAGLVNPYGTGHAAVAIVEGLSKVALDQRLLLKRFHFQPPPQPS